MRATWSQSAIIPRSDWIPLLSARMFLALEKDNERFPEQSRRSFETLQTVLPRQKFPVDGEGCVRAPSPDYSCKSYDRLLELHTSATVVGFVSMWAGGGGGSACCNMDSESSITLRASSLYVHDGSTPALLLQSLGLYLARVSLLPSHSILSPTLGRRSSWGY